MKKLFLLILLLFIPFFSYAEKSKDGQSQSNQSKYPAYNQGNIVLEAFGLGKSDFNFNNRYGYWELNENFFQPNSTDKGIANSAFMKQYRDLLAKKKHQQKNLTSDEWTNYLTKLSRKDPKAYEYLKNKFPDIVDENTPPNPDMDKVRNLSPIFLAMLTEVRYDNLSILFPLKSDADFREKTLLLRHFFLNAFIAQGHAKGKSAEDDRKNINTARRVIRSYTLPFDIRVMNYSAYANDLLLQRSLFDQPLVQESFDENRVYLRDDFYKSDVNFWADVSFYQVKGKQFDFIASYVNDDDFYLDDSVKEKILGDNYGSTLFVDSSQLKIGADVLFDNQNMIGAYISLSSQSSYPYSLSNTSYHAESNYYGGGIYSRMGYGDLRLHFVANYTQTHVDYVRNVAFVPTDFIPGFSNSNIQDTKKLSLAGGLASAISDGMAKLIIAGMTAEIPEKIFSPTSFQSFNGKYKTYNYGGLFYAQMPWQMGLRFRLSPFLGSYSTYHRSDGYKEVLSDKNLEFLALNVQASQAYLLGSFGGVKMDWKLTSSSSRNFVLTAYGGGDYVLFQSPVQTFYTFGDKRMLEHEDVQGYGGNIKENGLFFQLGLKRETPYFSWIVDYKIIKTPSFRSRGFAFKGELNY